MKPIDILEAIGEADDRAIQTARKKPDLAKKFWFSFTATAACLGIVLGVWAIGNRYQFESVDFPETETSYTPGTTHAAGNLMEGITAEVVSHNANLPEGNEILANFALALLKATATEEENTLLSPLSVLNALGMTANGAEGDTLAELEAIFGMNREELNLYLLTYKNALPQGDSGKLKLANSIWFRATGSFQAERDFLQKNANYYDATLYEVPFDAATLRDINDWVKLKTDGMIPSILDRIPDRAVMYLINALAFEADWAKAFPTEDIKPGAFVPLSGERQTVDMMTGTETAYLADGNARGFVKYFKEGGYAFAALLPKDGMTPAEYLTTLDGEALTQMLANPTEKEVEVTIPRFEAAYEADLVETLHQMGVEKLFDQASADLSSLGQAEENLFASRVIHKTYFAISETGARAGAATAVEIKEAEGITELETIRFSRPFVYMLFDTQTNIPFFIGTAMSME